MIIEMRTYKIKPGKRTEFLELLESKAIPEHHKIAMKSLGHFCRSEMTIHFSGCALFPTQRGATGCEMNSTWENFGRNNSKRN